MAGKVMSLLGGLQNRCVCGPVARAGILGFEYYGEVTTVIYSLSSPRNNKGRELQGSLA
jgi:hypothetical protein